MRTLVFAPELMAQAILDPEHLCAKLLVVCAYGRYCQASDLILHSEEETMSDEPQAERRGGPSLDELVELSNQRRAIIEDQLPEVPDDLVMATSEQLLDRAESEVDATITGSRLIDPNASATSARRILVMTAIRSLSRDEEGPHPSHLDPHEPGFPAEPKASRLNRLIDVGLRTNAGAIVSDDPAIWGKSYAGEGREVEVIGHEELVADLERQGADVRAVDGELLERLVADL